MSLPLGRRLNAIYAWMVRRVGDRDKVRRYLLGDDRALLGDEEQPPAPTELKPRRHTAQEEVAGFRAMMGARTA